VASSACIAYEVVLSTTLPPDLIDEEKAGTVPFVVARQAILTVTMDMGVDHTGLVKLCRYAHMDPCCTSPTRGIRRLSLLPT